MATVIEGKGRVTEVHIEGLALLKIVKHCHESLPQMVTGSLLGLMTGNGVLEITHAFPFPDTVKQQHNADADGDQGDTAGLEGHEFQLEMMRMLREVNVDNNCIGWYQSMYLGIYSTSNLLENQLSYQTDLTPNAVVILYDPMQTSNGTMVLKCYRLTEECVKAKAAGKNSFIDPKNIFEEVPVKLTNPSLVRALLVDMADGVHTDNTSTMALTGGTGKGGGLYSMGADTSFDRLDLSTNPYLEKHLEFLSGWVDDLASEQHKFQHYTRQLSRPSDGGKGGGRGKRHKESYKGIGKEAWASSEAPRRMESLLISNQIRSYVDQMDKFAGAGLGKLYLAGSLHQEESSKKN